MILVNLFGGLGNQMFQYAFGDTINHETGIEVKYTIDTFRYYESKRSFLLNDVFNLDLPIANTKDVIECIGWKRQHPLIRRLLATNKFPKLRASNFFVDCDITSSELLYKYTSNNSYYYGHWCSEKYFKNNRERILDRFVFCNGMDQVTRLIVDEIMKKESIAVHVRRGDYLTSKKHSKLYNIIEKNYYLEAIEWMRNRVPEAKIFVFSDDIDWANTHIVQAVDNAKLVSNKMNADYIDMQLISLCSHQIISNSTFSWWAAWLNKNKNKKVIAPNKWYLHSENNIDDLIPNSWKLFNS